MSNLRTARRSAGASRALPPGLLPALGADLGACSVSGLSSGAFMAVQLHLAHAAMFVGAGIVAGGPYRCAESFPGASAIAEDAFVQNALFICMNPLTSSVGPQPERLARMARQSARDGLIDPVEHLARQRLYIFTGSQDKVVSPLVVQATRRFYELLDVDPRGLRFIDDVPAGHAILSDHPEYNPLETNTPPYGNRYMTTTGYNEMADTNDLVILYPQVEGVDDGLTQNPEGCWDWWGYSSESPQRPDYHTKQAVQIHAIHGMLQRLGEPRAA